MVELTALLSKSCRAVVMCLVCFTQYYSEVFNRWQKYYIYFVDNSLLFLTLKELVNS